MMCLGPFCGKFRNELGGSSSDEDEELDDAHNMLGKKKKKKKRRTNKKGGGAGGGAALAWAPYQSQTRLHAGEGEKSELVTKLEVVGNTNLGDNMINRINQLNQIGVIEIQKCGLEKIPPSLDELDGLIELRLPNNLIKKLPQELSQCKALQQLVLDHNHVSEIGPGIFSQMNSLKVVKLSNNRLQFLPIDFGSSPRLLLKSVDLSYNQLNAIPEKITMNHGLVELDLSHNKIKALPEAYELYALEKLFVSFNELTKLPANIGNSAKLRKLRITSNQVKVLPVSMLRLWKRPDRPEKDNGKLEELLVDRNPLQVPSITAFEMDAGRAGMDRAFRLLEEFKKEEDERIRREKEAAEQKALEDRKALELQDATIALAELPARPPSKDRSVVAASEAGQQLDAWYYGHCNGDEDMIREIREAEQKHLVGKRHKFLNGNAKLAEEMRGADGFVPEHMKVFLDPDPFLNYRGIVPLADIDLTLSLFVFAARPCYQSAYMWYDKFEQGLPDGGSKGFMTKLEWCELCLNSPLDVRQATMDKLWEYIMSMSSNSYGITVEDFIAVCHIHDIEARDPFIIRLTTALRLDYYDMTVSEMEQRLRSMNSLDATMQLNFDNKNVPPEHYDELVGDTNRRPGREDESQAALKDRGGLHKLLDSGSGAKKTANPREDNVENLLAKVSLTDFERKAAARRGNDEDNSDDESVDSVNSRLLSDDEASELSEFDAQAYMEQNKEDLIPSSSQATRSAQRIQVSSDSGLRQLMNVPLKDFFKGREEEKRKQEALGQVGSAWNRDIISKSSRFKRPDPHDSTWSTNVFSVRQALRDTYRNMPFFDFVSFVGFLLRGLHHIRESRNNHGDSHWHQDDPSFSFAMGAYGSSKYTSTLLNRMGFVRLNDMYWVWPSVHLVFTDASVVWGMAEVPSDCAGRDENRLEDMISLLTSCVIALNTKKQSFTGHFTGRESAQPTMGLAATEEVRL